MSTSPAASYSDPHIRVLKGLEHIRARPGLYIGSTDSGGLHSLLRGVIFYSPIFTYGRAGGVEVELLADGGCVVRDHGAGLPVEVECPDGRSVVDFAMQEVSAGRSPDSPEGAFLASFHVKAANALSQRAVLEVRRGGLLWRQEYARGGATTRLAPVAPSQTTGTSLTFWPDPDIFKGTFAFSCPQVRRWLRDLASLHPKATFLVRDHRPGLLVEERIERPAGLKELVSESCSLPAVHPTIIQGELQSDAGEAQVALRWCQDAVERILAFANDKELSLGGTPIEGLRTGLAQSIRRCVAALPPGSIAPTGRAYRCGLVACVSVRVEEPLFESATHGRLGNREVVPLVASATRQALDQFLRDHASEREAILAHLANPTRADPNTGMPL